MNSITKHSVAAPIAQRGIPDRRAAALASATLTRAVCCAGVVAALVTSTWAADEATPSNAADPVAGSGFSAADASESANAPSVSATHSATRSATPSATHASTHSSAGRSGTESLQKVGEARLRVLLWSIYNSRLYTPTGTYTESERPLRLEIEYLINVKSTALVDRTASEWDAMGRKHPRRDEWLKRLNSLWPNIGKRDVLTVNVDENDVSTFFHNGERLGRIEDPAFGREFLAIWLSEDSTRPAMRKDLIGTNDLN